MSSNYNHNNNNNNHNNDCQEKRGDELGEDSLKSGTSYYTIKLESARRRIQGTGTGRTSTCI